MLGKFILNVTYYFIKYSREEAKCILKWRALSACSCMKINYCLVSIDQDLDIFVLATLSGDHNPTFTVKPIMTVSLHFPNHCVA